MEKDITKNLHNPCDLCKAKKDRRSELNDGLITKYRLLKEGEQLQPGDENLCDDCETWETIGPVWLKSTYRVKMFQPMRRKVGC